ncbi:MAG: putative toxin-antitoxin system toxin component, PIN family [Deltaproteobacteria bacterium]|nr:putative toxin-antitoxin system toxin component, PIN family [Deltaproteobacteria bacterium]MBW2153568.1 putative toxin-antitoxin system toxin component, PIN family [Deltaproteobacteria bacterium]
MGTIKVIRAVLDTNVVVSALLFGGVPGNLVSLYKTGRLQLLVSQQIIDEYLRVLAYPKFRLSVDEIYYLIYEEILSSCKVVNVKAGPVIIKQDPADDKFLHCAVAGKAHTVISGDQHLLAMQSYRNIKILTPADFLKQFRI